MNILRIEMEQYFIKVQPINQYKAVLFIYIKH